ncbi:MAG: hypothetical protein P4L51_04595 [Puia sp.]|nr:hypothetical protein [Puia sp.]
MIPKYAILALALIFADEASAKWSPPTSIMNFTTWPKVYGIYSDSTSSHLILRHSDPNDSALYYLRIRNDKLDLNLSFPSVPSIRDAAISGDDLSHRVFVAYEEYDDTISFVESLDAGITWSTPVKLSTQPSTLGAMQFIKESGRVFLLYHRPATGEAIFVSRPKDSAVFSPEHVVWRVNESTRISACYTSVSSGNKQTIHAVAVEFNGSAWTLAERYTSSNGVVWSQPRVITAGMDRHYQPFVFSDSRVTDSFFVFYLGYYSQRQELVYSADEGATYSKNHTFNQKGIFNLQARICGDRSRKTLVVAGLGYFHLTGWERGNLTAVVAPRPFDYNSWIDCRDGIPRTEVTMFGRFPDTYSDYGFSRFDENSAQTE